MLKRRHPRRERPRAANHLLAALRLRTAPTGRRSPAPHAPFATMVALKADPALREPPTLSWSLRHAMPANPRDGGVTPFQGYDIRTPDYPGFHPGLWNYAALRLRTNPTGLPNHAPSGPLKTEN